MVYPAALVRKEIAEILDTPDRRVRWAYQDTPKTARKETVDIQEHQVQWDNQAIMDKRVTWAIQEVQAKKEKWVRQE